MVFVPNFVPIFLIFQIIPIFQNVWWSAYIWIIRFLVYPLCLTLISSGLMGAFQFLRGGGWGLISPHFAEPLWGLKREMFKVHHFHWKGKGYYIGFMKKKIQISSPWLMAAAWRSASIYHILEKVQNQFFGSSSKIRWNTPRVFCINIFLRCTPWLPVAILLFPKNAIIWFYSLMAQSPHGPWTPKQFKKIQ